MTSIRDLFETAEALYRNSNKDIFLILVGGCSRAGKSTLSLELSEEYNKRSIENVLINLDSWLISVNKRKPDSLVIERYEMSGVNSFVSKLLKGESVSPPVYDPVTRMRIEGVSGHPVKISSGVVIIEGVVALADENLLTKSDLKIFVEVSDELRMTRLVDFYGQVKKIEKPVYEEIIASREKEETLFVKRTAKHADILFGAT